MLFLLFSAEFFHDMQSRIQHIQRDWNHKLDDFTQRHSRSLPSMKAMDMNAATHHHNNPLVPLTPFRVLLQLFAYQDVIDSGKLDAVFEMDQGKSMTFFVPQLLSFLLHGAYYESDPTKLEAWILDKCSKHIHFAHRCFWFLRAWSLEERVMPSPLTPSGSLSSLQDNSNSNNMTTSDSQTSLRVGIPRTSSSSGIHSRSNSLSSLTGLTGGVSTPRSNDKLLPEERAVVEDLMLRVAQCGEGPARVLHFGMPPARKRRGKREKILLPKSTYACTSTETNPASPVEGENDGDHLHGLFWDEKDDAASSSPSSYTMVPEIVLTREMEETLPISHLETLTSPQRYGFMPLANAKKRQLEEVQQQQMTSSFQATPRFLDALLTMADDLFLVPRDQRKKELRRNLQAIEAELLPSNAVYIPIANPFHRVWRIVAEESIALNTKERVPCIILLEVVDYDSYDIEHCSNNATAGGTTEEATPIEKKTKTLELPKLALPRPAKKVDTVSPPVTNTTSPKHGVASVSSSTSPSASTTLPSLPFSLPYYTMMGGMSETDIVNHWRFSRRDPHRGESILEKMTSSLPLDIVKEKIHQLRFKQEAMFQELLAPSSHDDDEIRAVFEDDDRMERAEKNGNSSFSDPTPNDSEMAAFLCNDGYGEINKVHSNTNARELSPERGPEAKMGQWSSPTTKRSSVSFSGLMADPCFAQQKNDNFESTEQSSSAYGSTCDGRFNGTKGRPPRGQSRMNSDATTEMSKNTRGTTSHKNNKRASQQVVFRENWQAKEDRIRSSSAFGSHPGWRLLPILVKANDDLRQEQLASQLIQRMAFILARERVPVWLCPYEIIAITDSGGIVEAIPDTISLDSLKRNDPNFVDLNAFFNSFFGDTVENLSDAKSNFVESLAAYSMVTFLLQIKDRHNGNILLDNRGHIIHIDFGFFFLSSPGKNTGFESAPFKLTKDFVAVLGGPESHTFRTFRELCVRSFIVLRRHCMEIILLVEMLKAGNEDLNCFQGRPDEAIKGMRERFRLDLSDRACKEYVHSLIDESLENWRTNWYDRYQRYCVGVL